MWIFLTVLSIIILIPIFFICQKWRITLQYYGGELTIKVGKIKIYSSARQKRKKKDNSIKIPKMIFGDLVSKGELVKEIYREEKHEVISILQELERKLEFKIFNLSVTFGFGDAAVTGIANGFVWSGINGIVSIIRRYVDLNDKINIAVFPHYTESCFDVDICVIFDTRFIRMFGILKRAKRLYKRNKCKIIELGLVVR